MSDEMSAVALLRRRRYSASIWLSGNTSRPDRYRDVTICNVMQGGLPSATCCAGPATKSAAMLEAAHTLAANLSAAATYW